MRKNRYKLWASQLLGLFLMVFGLAACGQEKKSSSTLVLVTSADNPPFEFYQASSDHGRQITGFDIALAREICSLLGFDLEIKDVPFSSIIPSLQSGRADFAMSSLSLTPERQRVVEFSLPYFETRGAIITLPGILIEEEKDLEGKTVGVQLGSSYESALMQSLDKYPAIKVRSLNQVGELVQELRAKRIDGVITEESVARAYVGSNRDIEMTPLKGFKSSFSIAFPKKSELVEKFNQAIRELEEKGIIKQLKKEWFKTG